MRKWAPAFAAVAAASAATWLIAAAPATQPKSPADPTPTLVTLHYANAPSDEVLKDFFGQIGFDYAISSPGGNKAWPTVTIDADRRPYWEVVSQLDDAMGANIQAPRNGKIMVSQYGSGTANEESGVRCISGQFMVVAHVISHQVKLTDADHPDDCAINLLLLAEPQLRIASFPTEVQPEVAVDENGKSLLGGASPAITASNSQESDTDMQIEVTLQPTADSGHKIADVIGEIPVDVIAGYKKIEIAAGDFPTGQSFDLNGATIKIPAIVQQPTSAGAPPGAPPAYRVTLVAERNGLSDADWASVGQQFQGVNISIRDDSGVEYSAPSGGGSGSDKERTIFTNFRAARNGPPNDKLGPPAKCIITLPATLRSVRVPFEFKNLPLP